MKKQTIDYRIMIPTILIILLIFFSLIIYPEEMKRMISQIYSFVIEQLGWSYIVLNLLAFAFLIWITFSKYGDVVLGDVKQPEYSNFSWASMLFTSGVGSSVVILGFIEPLYYVAEPPFNIEAYSNEAYEYAHMYGQFHWGASAWAFYIPAIVAVGLVVYKAGIPALRLSAVMKEMHQNKDTKWIRIVMDVIVMVGILGGIATSLGLAVPVIARLLSGALGIPNNLQLQIVILGVWILLFSFSVFRGLDKGIKWLSNLNIALLFVFLGIVLFSYSAMDIMKMEVNSVGLYFQNFIRISTWTDPFGDGNFQKIWTIFYWGWWLTFMPLMALFIVRISRGRTIRSVVWQQMLWGTLGCWICFGIFGGVSLKLQKDGIVNLAEILQKQGQEAVMEKILNELPATTFLGVLFCILVFIFLATTIDSAAYILASNSSKNLENTEQPARFYRVFWAGVLAILSVALLIIGELKAVQTMSLLVSIPLMPVQIYMCYSGVKLMKKYGKSNISRR